jgi:two-component system, LytTR family, sensor kinase
LLKEHDTFVALREELNFTEDYLGIEVVRFGADKLRVVKDIDPATLEMLVPSMLLQPLIENSIKHGIEPRISGGTITMRSRLRETSMMIEVEDDGVGMGESARTPGGAVVRKGTGIGMKNVRERLEVLYGETARFDVMSRPGRGTRVTLEIPVMLNENGDPMLAATPVRGQPVTRASTSS